MSESENTTPSQLLTASWALACELQETAKHEGIKSSHPLSEALYNYGMAVIEAARLRQTEVR